MRLRLWSCMQYSKPLFTSASFIQTHAMEARYQKREATYNLPAHLIGPGGFSIELQATQ